MGRVKQFDITITGEGWYQVQFFRTSNPKELIDWTSVYVSEDSIRAVRHMMLDDRDISEREKKLLNTPLGRLLLGEKRVQELEDEIEYRVIRC